MLIKRILIICSISFLVHIQKIPAEVIKDIHVEDIYLSALEGKLKKMRTEGFVTSSHPPWPLDLPLDWGANPFKDRDWQFQLNTWRMIDQYIIEYFETQDKSLIEKSLKFVEDWHDYHFVKNKTSDFSWEDMATGIRAMRLAFYINAIRKNLISVDDKLKKKIYFLANQHINKLQQENFFSKTNNHGIFALAGLHLLCREHFENPACNSDTKTFIKKTFKEIFDKQFTEEGVHTEGNPEYHFYITKTLNHKIKAPVQEILGDISNLLTKAEKIKPWLLFPNKILSRVGDSRGRLYNISFDSLKSIEPACIEKDKCYLVGDLTKSGYAIIRTIPETKDESMLFVTGMAHNVAHKHADDLSFQLFEFGRFIFIDTGSYSDEFNTMRKYIISTAAHNTISVQNNKLNPVNVKKTEAENDQYETLTWREVISEVNTVEMTGSFLKSVKAMDNKFEVHGKVDRKNLFSQERYIYYIPGKKLRIEDKLLSSNEHNYVSSLHFAPDINVVLFKNNAYADFGNGSLHAKILSENCQLSMARGQKNPILGWANTGKYGEMIPTTVVQATCPGKNRTIIWEIEFYKKFDNLSHLKASSDA